MKEISMIINISSFAFARAMVVALGLLVSTLPGRAADWPQYRGPNHDGSSPEKILKHWPQEGPRQIWKATLARASARSPSAAAVRLFHPAKTWTVRTRKRPSHWDANTGKELWGHAAGQADLR